MPKLPVDRLFFNEEDLNSMGLAEVKFSVPKRFRKGRLRAHENQSVGSAIKILEYIQGLLEIDSMKEMDVFDFGCGVKFTQAFLQKEFGIKSYFGVDVDDKMLQYLKNNVKDERFSYQAADFQNDMYNPNGKLSIDKNTKLDCYGKTFDLITLQSVFTHFGPKDVINCLAMLKQYLKPDGKIIFTCLTAKKLDQPFKDLKKDRPLLLACFNRSYLEQIIEEAGYRIEYFRDKDSFLYLADHYMVSHAVS